MQTLEYFKQADNWFEISLALAYSGSIFVVMK